MKRKQSQIPIEWIEVRWEGFSLWSRNPQRPTRRIKNMKIPFIKTVFGNRLPLRATVILGLGLGLLTGCAGVPDQAQPERTFPAEWDRPVACSGVNDSAPVAARFHETK
jgi:hypothetical protein